MKVKKKFKRIMLVCGLLMVSGCLMIGCSDDGNPAKDPAEVACSNIKAVCSDGFLEDFDTLTGCIADVKENVSASDITALSKVKNCDEYDAIISNYIPIYEEEACTNLESVCQDAFDVWYGDMQTCIDDLLESPEDLDAYRTATTCEDVGYTQTF